MQSRCAADLGERIAVLQIENGKGGRLFFGSFRGRPRLRKNFNPHMVATSACLSVVRS